MISEIRKSIAAYLYERNSSPLWGTFIVCWCVWNWRILYVTIVVSERVIPNKLAYIESNFSNYWDMLWTPLISTTVVIVVVPIISMGAYWLTLEYENFRRGLKLKHEKGRVLTIDESNQILEDAAEQEITFNKTINQKNSQIGALEKRIGDLSNDLSRESKRLFVVSARYGTQQKFQDVTGLLNNEIVKNGSLKMTVNNPNLGGDPAPNEPKTLSVVYLNQGKGFWNDFQEGASVNIM